MLIVERSVWTRALPEAVWQIWADVENWNSWDHGIEYSTLEGPFAVGTKGRLKPQGGPPVHTELTAVEFPRSFVDESQLPLTRIIVSHQMEREGSMTKVTHRVEMKGFLSPLFAILIGRKMKRNMLQEMEAMVRKAERL